MAEFTSAEREFILQQSLLFWETSSQSMSTFFSRVSEFERLTKGLLPTSLETAYAKYPDRSALVPPDLYLNQIATRAMIRRTLFRRKPYFKLYRGGHPNVRDMVIKKAEQTAQALIDEDNGGSGFVTAADQVNDQTLYAGVGAAFIEWTTEYDRVVERDQFNLIQTKNGKPVFKRRPVAIYPRIIPVDIRRIRVPRAATKFHTSRLIGFHHVEPMSELINNQREPAHFYKFNEQELRDSTFQKDKYFEYSGGEMYKHPDKGMVDGTLFGDKSVEVFSLRGLFRFENPDGSWEYKDLVVDVGNRCMLLGVKENDSPLYGWEHFQFATVDDKIDLMFPMGLVEPARDTFIEQFVKHNQSLDSANRNTYLTIVADAGAAAGLPEYLDSANDQILKLDLGANQLQSVRDAIDVLQRPQLGQDTFQHSVVLSRMVQQVYRLNDYTQGRDPSSTETATAVASMVSGSRAGGEFLIEKLIDSFYAPVVVKFLRLWNHFMGEQKHKIYGTDGTAYDIDPGEIDLPFHCTVESLMGETSPAMQRRAVESFPVLITLPNIDKDILTQTFVDVLELPNGDRMVKTNDLTMMDVDRENMALASGVPQPVHPNDDHFAHHEFHMRYIQEMSQMPPEQMAGQNLDLDAVMQHDMEHQEYINEMNMALGNTKEMGGNAGDIANPDSASEKSKTRPAQGNYTASEGRR